MILINKQISLWLWKNNFLSLLLTLCPFVFKNVPTLSISSVTPEDQQRVHFPVAFSLNAGCHWKLWLCRMCLHHQADVCTPKPLNQSPWGSAEGSIPKDYSCREYNSFIFMSQPKVVRHWKLEFSMGLLWWTQRQLWYSPAPSVTPFMD